MSLQHVAKVLEKQGRKGDSMLMHVNPIELQVLESMLGKTTVNPTTGLPEAFSWKKLLAGIALGIAAIPTGGTSLLGALGMAGGLSAGAATAAGLAGGAIGANLIGSSLKPSDKKGTVSDAAKYLDARNEQRIAGQYKFAPPMTMLSSISDKVYDASNPRTNLLGQEVDWSKAPSQIPKMGQGFAKGGQITEAQAKQTVLGMLAQMQQQGQPMAHGRRVQGPGTGLDDSIPARLSVGEYVIPADVVSMMGDGSTEAGGRRLDELLAKVRMHKTGTKKQAPALPMGKVMGRP